MWSQGKKCLLFIHSTLGEFNSTFIFTKYAFLGGLGVFHTWSSLNRLFISCIYRPVLSRLPSVTSTVSGETRRPSLILDMREAISESGKRLSAIVAENQSRALESLLADMNGQRLSTTRKVGSTLV